jgi:hypothetical protein
VKADHTPETRGKRSPRTAPTDVIALDVTGPDGAIHAGPVDSAVLSLSRTIVRFGADSPAYYTTFRSCTLRFVANGLENRIKLGPGFASLRSGRLTIVTETIVDHTRVALRESA